MKVRNHFISWLALTLLFQPSWVQAQDAPQSAAPADLPTAEASVNTLDKPVSVHAVAGIQTMSGQGGGEGGSLKLSPFRFGADVKNADGSSAEVGISAGPQLYVQGQSGVSDAGKPTLARGQLQLRLVGGADAHVASSDGSGGMGMQLFGGAEVTRNLGLSRDMGANLHTGFLFELKGENVTFRSTTTGEMGMNKSSGKLIPFLQAHSIAELEDCFNLGASNKNQLCTQFTAMIAAGLVQVEIGAGASVTYQRRIASDGAKIYIGPQAEAGATADLAGTHSFTQAGAALGIKF